MNGILSRNVEFQRLIVDYQKQLRESAQSLLAAEEHSRKLSMEVSVVLCSCLWVLVLLCL